MTTPLFSLKNIAKTYVLKEGPVLAVSALTILRGEVIALVGFSGSGKTTLLSLLAMLETPDSSFGKETGFPPSILFRANPDSNAEELLGITDRRRQELRSTFGFVFQQGYLLENLNCAENITIPFNVRGLETSAADVPGMMQMVGLDGGMTKRTPSELSGGERQRVSVLRALGHGPSVVFADEPTSNLDESNATIVLTGLRSWCKAEANRTILLVTHNIAHAAKYADSVVVMASGNLCGPIAVEDASGKRLTASEISYALNRFAEEVDARRTQQGAGATPALKIGTPPPATSRSRNLRRFIRSFALSDVFPPVSGAAAEPLFRRLMKRGIFQGLTRRRNAQFHSMASMFLAMVLALFFASLYSSLADEFRSLIDDRRIARVEVLGRSDGEQLLSQKDVDDLGHLAWATGPGFSGIASPDEIRQKGLTIVRPAVQTAVGYRVRELRTVRKTAAMSFGSTSETEMNTVSTADSDPILKKIEVLKGKSMSDMVASDATVDSVFRASPDAKAGIVCTKSTLTQLGFTDALPKSLSILPPYSSGDPISVPLVAVVDWLPKSADALVTEDLFRKFFFDGGSGDPLPRYESVDLYFDDMMKDGIALYDALQRSGYSVSADRLGLLRWVVSLVRAIRYFGLAAASGVFLVVLVTLIVSYTEAIRRKEKQIGVLLAYGTPMWLLYAVFIAEVVLVWMVAAVFAVPFHWFVATSVERLVAQGFELRNTQAVAAPSAPWGLWSAILVTSLLVALGSVSLTMFQRVDRKKVAETLRAPD